MRNLKKLLALVLALMMVVSVMVTVNAASTDDYSAAVKALQNYGVLEGYEDGQIHADNAITRADMAAIIYRIMTGDTAGGAEKNAAVATKYGAYASKFSDAKEAPWALGYIGWCANKGVLKGYGNGKVQPNEKITGYEVQAMLLRTLGYDRNNEYTGSDWEYNVLSDATKTAINKGVSTDPAKATPRGAVAQLTYNAVRNTEMVAPAVVPSIGYKPLGTTLISVGAATEDTDAFGAYTQSTAIYFNWPDTPVPGSYNTVTKPLWETWDAVTECDVATNLNATGQHWAKTYTNGTGNVNLWNGNAKNTTAMPFEATDTVNKIGHEGRHLMVYKNPDYVAPESPTNPMYIFVFVDEFYAKVDSAWSEVKDPAGHVITAAGANVTVYSNTYANGSGTIGSGGNVAAATYQTTLSGNYTAGQVLGVHMLTKTDTNGLTTGAAIANGTAAQNTVGYGPVTPLNTANVTIKDVTMDAKTGATAGDKPVGIVTETGARYYYNYTFSGTPIAATDIGKSAVLTLDSQGNILSYYFVTNAPGYGVTRSAVAKQIAINEWVLTYTILLPNGTTTTIDVGQASSGNVWPNQSGAESYYSTVGANVLVHYTMGTGGKYYVFDQTNLITASLQDNTVKSGRPAALSLGYDTTASVDDDPVRGNGTITDGTLVNDETVFFVAEYVPNNVTGTANDYTMTGYQIYTGFKNIPDLTSLSGAVSDVDGKTSLATLSVTAFDVDPATGAPKTAAVGQFAKYVLVLNAVKQSTPTKIATKDFAYLITDDLFVDVGANTFTYPAIIDGKPGQSLQVKLVGGNPMDESGLYTYSNYVNGQGYTDVYLMDRTDNSSLAKPYNGSFTIDKAKYEYANGVLASLGTAITYTGTVKNTVTYANSDVYYAVAAGCPVYLVNPTTGAVTTRSLDLLNVMQYTQNCDIWFQLDANGYVSLIYMIETAAATTPTPPTTSGLTLTLNNATVTGSKGSATITVNSLKVGGTGTLASGSPTVTVSYVIEKWTDNGWTAYCTATNDVTLTSGTYTFSSESVTADTPLYEGTYRVTVTAKSGDATAKLTEYLGLSITGTP